MGYPKENTRGVANTATGRVAIVEQSKLILEVGKSLAGFSVDMDGRATKLNTSTTTSLCVVPSSKEATWGRKLMK